MSKSNVKSKKTNFTKENQFNPMMQNQFNPMMQNQFNPMIQNPMIYNQFNPMMQMQMQNPMQNPMIYNQYNPMMQMQMQNPMMQMQMPNSMMMQMPNPMMMQMPNPMMMQMPNPMIQKQKYINPKDIQIDDFDRNLDDDLDDDTESSETLDNSEIEFVSKPISKPKKYEIKKNELINSKKRKIISEENIFENLEVINDKPINDENNLANLFDNVLDNRNMNKKHKKDKDVSFLPYKDGRNVINNINPIDDANFNNDSHPDEKYYVQFLDGHNETIQAKNINISALKTQKITFENNQKLNNKLKNIIGLPDVANTIIYVRCSKENDTSIETQTKACCDYALQHNMKLLPYGYLEDNGISARNGNNFKSGELSFWFKHIPNNTHIIIYSPDRWCRHTTKGLQALDDLTLKNITIHFVNNKIKYNRTISSANKAMIQTELMTAEKLSNDTSEKIKGTLDRLKAEGHEIGKAAYGYKNAVVNGIRKKLVNTEEKNTIQKIKDMYLDINNNYNKYANEIQSKSKINMIKFIIRWCNRNGTKNRNGLSFTESQIRNIIKL
jgi:DNA invertase Pin-like site-specific DNA recombinase